jgi:radical SAM protein with 4Fe4S-binding SPASM domain
MRRSRPRRALEMAPERRHYLPLLDARPEDARYRPIYTVWEITLKCDLACRHCGSRAGKSRTQELTTAECLDVVRQLAEMGGKEVTLIGGEAYLRDDWIEIAREIKRRGMLCTMTTGGRGMTLERARQARDAGIQSVSVSFDGLEATHDRLRGVRGSFSSAREALKNLKEAGIRVSTNTQINRLNMPELPALMDMLLEERVRNWMIMITVPMGRAADEPEVLLQPYDLLELFPMLAELKQRADAAGLRVQPGNNLGYFGPYEHLLRHHTRSGHCTGCGAGRGTLGLEADGTIKGCPSLPTNAYAGGNVREHSLSEVWERAHALRYTRDRTVDDLWGFCRTCYYAETCMAGCTWASHVTLDRPGNNPYCHHRALEMARQGKRERLVRAVEAPGAPFDNGRFDIVVEDLASSGDRPRGGD